MSKRQTKLLPSKRISVIISRTNQDMHGNQTSSRTYYSTTKRVQRVTEGDELTDRQLQTPDEIDKQIPSKPTSKHKQKSSKPTKRYTQIPLFPTTE